MECLRIGKDRQVFWDDYIIDLEKTTAVRRLISPIKKECCVIFDKGNESINVSFPSIVKDVKGYKMYYSVVRPEEKAFSQKAYYLCVLESTDGIHWVRPHLNLFSHPELECNNVVIDAFEDGICVFYDENPACPPEEVYKALTRRYKTEGVRDGLWCWTSPDGYHFKCSYFMTEKGQFDSLNTAFWAGDRYVCYLRSLHGYSANGEYIEVTDLHNKEQFFKTLEGPLVRDIRVMYSTDFHHWTVPKRLEYEDGNDFEMYTNNVFPYERVPQLYVGFPTRYVERSEWTENEEQMASAAIKKLGMKKLEKRLGLAVTDCLFMCSRDGKNWNRYCEAWLKPEYEREKNWVYGDCYPVYRLIDSGSEAYYMYMYEENYNIGECIPSKLYRYEIRKDGFACLEAGAAEQMVVTKAFVFKGKNLHINFSTSAYGHIFVDVLDEDGNQLSDVQSMEVYGDNIDRIVYFADHSDFSRYEGKRIKLRFKMLDARLFSFCFE